MNCLECHDWLQRRLDGESVPDVALLDRHLAECPACRQQHHAAQVLLEGLRAWKRPVPSEELTRRIVAGVLADRLNSPWAWRRWVTGAAGLAAAVLLALLGWYVWKSNQIQPGDPGLVVEKKAPDTTPRDAGLSLSQSVEEARQAVTSLTERLAEEGQEQARMLLSTAPSVDVGPMMSFPMAGLEQPLDPAAQSLRQTGQGVSQGLQTVAQSAGRAVAYFFEDLSPPDMGRRN